MRTTPREELYDLDLAFRFLTLRLDACGKPKSRGLREVSAAVESLATRSNSPAQSMGGRARPRPR